MKKWQKYWLYFVITYAIIHLIRDVLQDVGVKVFLSTIFVKQATHQTLSRILFLSFNAYVIAVIEIVLAITCLIKKQFGKIGLLTIIIASITLLTWAIYWFFL